MPSTLLPQGLGTCCLLYMELFPQTTAWLSPAHLSGQLSSPTGAFPDNWIWNSVLFHFLLYLLCFIFLNNVYLKLIYFFLSIPPTRIVVLNLGCSLYSSWELLKKIPVHLALPNNWIRNSGEDTQTLVFYKISSWFLCAAKVGNQCLSLELYYRQCELVASSSLGRLSEMQVLGPTPEPLSPILLFGKSPDDSDNIEVLMPCIRV